MSLAETQRLALRIAGVLRGGDILTLEGDLGAGKTTLVQAMGPYWGLAPGDIRSPTFSLLHVLELDAFDLVHADLYRMTEAEEVETSGLGELLGAPDCVCIVEWPALAQRYLSADTLGVKLSLDPLSGARSLAVNPALQRRLHAVEELARQAPERPSTGTPLSAPDAQP